MKKAHLPLLLAMAILPLGVVLGQIAAAPTPDVTAPSPSPTPLTPGTVPPNSAFDNTGAGPSPTPGESPSPVPTPTP